MERLSESLGCERLQSFDLLASVYDMRFDLQRYGRVLPETRQQICDEQLSYLAEGSGRAARPTFILERRGDELLYFNKGQWQPYSLMLATGLQTAQLEASYDPRRQFLVDWAQNDLYHYSQMRRLSPGESYTWASLYPDDQERRFGRRFMQECGLQAERRMGFLYRATCREDGYVILESQTIDRSDEDGFRAALQAAQSNPTASLDSLVGIYDEVLAQKFGGQFYAGQREADHYFDTWEKILAQADLIEYLLNGLETIARQAAPTEQLEATKRHIYGVWALFKKRLDGTAPSAAATLAGSGNLETWLTQQTSAAFYEFASAGHVLIGCGGDIAFLANEADILNAAPEDVFSAIFGNGKSSASCEFTSKKCPLCGAANVRTRVTKTRITGSCGCSKAKAA